MAQGQKQQGKPQTTRLPLMGAYSNRGSDGTKDQRFVNMFPETRKVDQLENTKIFINKRPGLSLYRDFGTGDGRGNAYFNSKFYVAVGNKVYSWDGATQSEILTLTGSTGQVGMINANSSTIGNYLFICDGTSAWIINTSGTVTQITNTSIHTITITNAGLGYGTAPSVIIGGAGGAAAIATTSGSVVTAITISNYGTGYVSPPTITIGAPVLTFDPTTTINTTTNEIAITNTYSTGTAVVYANGGGGSPAPLVSGTTYYIIAVSGSAIKLATSSANATAGTAIDLTTVGTGTTHTLTGTVTATATSTLTGFPSPHVPSPTFIDGYIVLARASSVDVYTCDLDSPTLWSAENFLSAEMFPDSVVALARQNNQVIVFGTSSIEFFYDAANASGSPLSRNDSTTIQIGTAAPYCIYQNERYCAYVSQSDSGGRAVWVIEGFQPKKVTDEYIERILDSEVDMSDCRGFGLRTKGHMFYVVNLKTIGRTLVYDFDEKLWHEWSSNSTGSHAVFGCDYMSDNSTGMAFLLHSSNGTLYKLDPSVYTDDGTTILCELVTNKYDMDTYNRKFMSSLKIVGDRYSSANSVVVYWSDNDYQTWSNAKTIDLTDDFPAFHRLGSFRRRAFKLTHATNNPFRVESLECVYNEGTY